MVSLNWIIIGLFLNIMLLGILFSSEVLTDEFLRFISKINKRWGDLLIFLRLNIVSLLITLLSSLIVLFFVSLFEDESTVALVGLYRTIAITVLSGALYIAYLSYPVRSFFMNIENKRIQPINQKINSLIFKNREASATLNNNMYDDTITGRLNNIKKEQIILFTSWSDSIVLIFTALGLLLSAYKVSGVALAIYVVLFISIIIAKIRLNHLKEDTQKINTKNNTDKKNV